MLIRQEIQGADEEEGAPLWGHKVVPKIDHPCSVSETATPSPAYFPTFPFTRCRHSSHGYINTNSHVITFTSNKRFGLVDKDQLVLVGNTDYRCGVGDL